MARDRDWTQDIVDGQVSRGQTDLSTRGSKAWALGQIRRSALYPSTLAGVLGAGLGNPVFRQEAIEGGPADAQDFGGAHAVAAYAIQYLAGMAAIQFIE